jgi:hypothetical protein
LIPVSLQELSDIPEQCKNPKTRFKNAYCKIHIPGTWEWVFLGMYLVRISNYCRHCTVRKMCLWENELQNPDPSPPAFAEGKSGLLTGGTKKWKFIPSSAA